MPSRQDALQRAKLSLVRLNEDWSLTGDTFCHQAASILRRDITGDAVADTLNIQTAIAHMVKRYATVCDPYEGQYHFISDPHNVSRWNNQFEAANNIVEGVIASLSYRDQQQLSSETFNIYSKLFNV